MSTSLQTNDATTQLTVRKKCRNFWINPRHKIKPPWENEPLFDERRQPQRSREAQERGKTIARKTTPTKHLVDKNWKYYKTNLIYLICLQYFYLLSIFLSVMIPENENVQHNTIFSFYKCWKMFRSGEQCLQNSVQILQNNVQIRRMFNRADKDGSGSLTKEEWHSVLNSSGCKTSMYGAFLLLMVTHRKHCQVKSQSWTPPDAKHPSMVIFVSKWLNDDWGY